MNILIQLRLRKLRTGIIGITAFGTALAGSFGLASIPIALVGIAATGVSAAALNCLDLLVAPQHNMENHCF